MPSIKKAVEDLRKVAPRFANDAADVFKRMNWTWQRGPTSYVPNRSEILKTTRRLIDMFKKHNNDANYWAASTGRICVTAMWWPATAKWDLDITLDPMEW